MWIYHTILNPSMPIINNNNIENIRDWTIVKQLSVNQNGVTYGANNPNV